MGIPKKDHTGKRFGSLVVLCEDVEKTKKYKRMYWKTQCDCGDVSSKSASGLMQKSAGCRKCRFNRELIGKTFRNVLVLRESNKVSTRGKRHIICLCILCNQEFETTRTNLHKINGCGCSKTNGQRVPGRYTGIHGLPPGESMRNRQLRQYKRGARDRGLCWELTQEEFNTLTSGTCIYCGSGPSLHTADRVKPGYLNGIDRLDSSKGYTPDNCVTCCSDCNEMKMGRTRSEFMTHVNNIVNYLTKANFESDYCI